jgi:nucleoside-diphosphate-sugar epimerase
VREGGGGPRGVTLHQTELNNPAALDRCLAEVRPDIVHHLATRTHWQLGEDLSDAAQSLLDDVGNLITLLAALARSDTPPRAFVRAGTLAEYGPGPAPFNESQREQPINTYGAALAAGTHYCQMLQSRLPFPVVTARLALVYGPGQSAKYLLPTLVSNCRNGIHTELQRPDDRRDLMEIRDAVRALALLGDSPPRDSSLLNVTTGIAPTMKEVAELVIAATGCDPNLVSCNPGPVTGGTVDLRGAPDLMRDLTGWYAEIPLSSGIENLVVWYRGQAQNDGKAKA